MRSNKEARKPKEGCEKACSRARAESPPVTAIKLKDKK